jgi:outer membrane receptor protein involved in Fe transport
MVKRCICRLPEYDLFQLTSYYAVPTLEPANKSTAGMPAQTASLAGSLRFGRDVFLPSDAVGRGRGVSKFLYRPGLVFLFVPLFYEPASAQMLSAAKSSEVAPAAAPAGSQTLPAIVVDTPPRRHRRNARVASRSQRSAGVIAAANTPAPVAVPGSGAPNVGGGPAAQPVLASQMTVTGEELNARPVTRPGEILEAAPGLIVTQHSGEGKANQYFLRGYNLDHGTDLAISADDVPVNLRTHAHGQGYSDLNWLMPETINSVEVRKGPYFADEGDFASAGNLHIGLIDSVNRNIASMTVGSFGYERIFGMGSTKLGDGTLLLAGEAGAYNGPWVNPDDMRKINSLLRYTQDTAQDGFSITGMAYSNRWNSTDQVPQRAITSGQIGLFGEEDPTDGGNTDRFALSARMAETDDAGSWKANAYVVKSDLDLFNDFTYFLTNPTLGDQFHQHDDRVMTGMNASRTLTGSFAGRPMETTFGVQTRYDDIDLGLTDTYQRSFLSDVRSDRVREASVGIYAQNTIHWTDWFRTVMGWRGDTYAANVYSIFDANNSGNV